MSRAFNTENEDVKRYEDVKKLPIEDTIWLIEENVVTDDDGLDTRYLTVTDKSNGILHVTNIGTCQKSFPDQCRLLLYECTLHPLIGSPRRPLKVTFKDLQSVKNAAGLDLSDFGIIYMHGEMKLVDIEVQARMRECYVCHLRGSNGLFIKCASCLAVLYCSKKCQLKDWSLEGPIEPHSHKHWCQRMKSYMAETDTLRNLPFTFSEETMSPEFDAVKYQRFLESQGVYQYGAWRRECLLLDNLHKTCSCHIPYGELSDSADLIVLPVESCILEDTPSGPPNDIRCWESYYNWREFRLDSPIAILLHWPLTVFYIYKHCLPNDFPAWCGEQVPSKLFIDIIGVESEVEMLPVFKELEYLCPDVSLDIQMYGNTISKKINGKTFEENNIKIDVIKGLYHKKSSTSRKPHFVIGFNAGLGAYRQWSQTLVKLRALKIPAYFTDYCQYSCAWARNHVEGLELGTISDPVINPFRKPVRKVAAEHDMPWYSNGFIYHLIYPT